MRPKQTAVLLTLALLLLMLPLFTASAQIKTWIEDDGLAGSFLRVTTFENELPEALRETLALKGLGDYPCYCGAQVETVQRDDEKGTVELLKALVALDTGAERILVYLDWSESFGWYLVPIGAKALLPGRDFSITLADLDRTTFTSLGSRFLIQYPRPKGGTESYGISSFRPLLPHVKTYELVDENGRGYAILNGYSEYGFRIRPLPLESKDGLSFDPENETFYPAYVPLWLEYMDSITAYPTTEAQAKEISEASLARYEEMGVGMAFGEVNLRKEPTSKSQSLGNILSGTLVEVLEQKPGNDAPWYHVRLGQEEGWASGVYVRFPSEQLFWTTLWSLPLPVAQTTDTRTLRAKPVDGAEAVAELPKGTRMHVVMNVPGDWLYVMIPQGELSWEMDVEGTGGYLRADEVEQGTSPSQLTP